MAAYVYISIPGIIILLAICLCFYFVGKRSVGFNRRNGGRSLGPMTPSPPNPNPNPNPIPPPPY